MKKTGYSSDVVTFDKSNINAILFVAMDTSPPSPSPPSTEKHERSMTRHEASPTVRSSPEMKQPREKVPSNENSDWSGLAGRLFILHCSVRIHIP